MNNHMYLVKNKKMVKSMVEKAKSIDHNIKTSLFENDEIVNHYNDKKMYTNKSIKNIKNNHNNKTNIIYMYSRDIKNINDIFDDFIIGFNLVPIVTRCNKTNIMEFHHIFEDGTRNIYCCDPNDINIINFNDIKKICDQNKIEWKNQTLTNVIGQIKDNYFDEKNGRVKFNKEQRTMLLNKFNNKCNTCQCCINDNNFHIDHITSLAGGGTNEECNLQVLCPSCHRDKCSSEHEQGQYIKPKETASFFNSEVRDIMNSDLAQQHAFVEKAYYGEVDKDKKLFSVINIKIRSF